MQIRSAILEDATAINRIYNYYVTNTAITFDITPWSITQREQWMHDFDQPKGLYNLLVAEQNGSLVGFACNRKFKEKAAYSTSTEITIYLDSAQCAKGIGTALYSGLFKIIDKTRLHRAYAAITRPNAASIALHNKFGFYPVGTMHEVGMKFGKYHSVTLLEKNLSHSVGDIGISSLTVAELQY